MLDPRIPLQAQAPRILSLADLRKMQLEEDASAQQSRLGDLRIQQAQGELSAQAASGERSQRIRQLFASGQATPEALLAEGEVDLAKGLQAFRQLESGAKGDAQKTAGEIAKAMKRLHETDPQMAAQLWPGVREASVKGGLGSAEQIPEQFAPAYLDAVLEWSGQAPAAPKTREVTVQNPDGSTSIQIVEDKPGQTFSSAPEPPKAGTLEYELAEEAKRLRKPLIALTPTERDRVRARVAAAGRAPEKANTEQEWVLRNGQITPIAKGTAQPGDKPYDAVSQRQATASDPQGARDVTLNALAMAQRLETHPGLGKATGAYELRGFTQDAVDFNAIRDQLVAALALPNLGALKGPMSDKDVIFVKNLATRLGNKRISEAETKTALTEAIQFLNGKLGSAPTDTRNAGTATADPLGIR